MDIHSFNEQITKDFEKFQNALEKKDWWQLHLSPIDEIIPTDSFVIIAGRPRTGRTTMILDFIAYNSLSPTEVVEDFKPKVSSRRGLVYFIGHKQQLIFRKWFSTLAFEKDYNSTPEFMNYVFEEIYLKRIEGAEIDFNFIDDCDDLISKIQKDMKRIVPDYIVVDGYDNYLAQAGSYEHQDQRYEEFLQNLAHIQNESKKMFLITKTTFGTGEWNGDRWSYAPKLGDVNSRLIEAKSDVVLMLHRPDLSGIDVDENGSSLKDKIQVITAVNKFGKDNATKWFSFKGGVLCND